MRLEGTPGEIRSDLIESLLKSSTARSLEKKSPDIANTLRQVDRVFKASHVVSSITLAYQLDKMNGDTSYTQTIKETKIQLVRAVGEEVAGYVLDQLLAKNPPALALSLILGPEIIHAIGHDVPVIAQRLKEVTGFEIRNGRVRFDPQPYDPREDPVIQYTKRQRELGEAVGELVRPKLPSAWDFLEDLGAKIVRFRDAIFGR